MVCEPSIINLINDDKTVFEQEPLINLANHRKLAVHKHKGFWAAMDTLRDKNYLEELWEQEKAPWKIWV